MSTRTFRTINNTRFAALGFGIALIAGSALTGCGGSAPRPAMEVVIALDASASARKGLPDGANFAAFVARRLRARRDGMVLFRVDHDCAQFGTGQTIGDDEATMALIDAEVRPLDKRRGTLPEKFWAQAEALARTSGSDEPLVIVFATDGDNDDMRPESSQRIAAHIAHIAAVKRVKGVVLFGVRRANMTTINAQFAPLGKRLRVFAQNENNPEAAARAVIECADAK